MSNQKIEADKFAEYEGIKKAIQPYIEAAMSGKGEKVGPMFYDHAHVVGSIGGDRMEVSADTFVKSLDEFGPSPDVEHHIAWIDISGPAAAVKLEFVNWLGNRFTDFFLLYKEGEDWKVTGKVFDAHGNN